MNEPTIPTEQEIADLPRWAKVAFAARCARRVQPLFHRGYPDATEATVAAVTRAIEWAEQAASQGRPTAQPIASGAYEAARAAGRRAAEAGYANSPGATSRATAASQAADAAHLAAVIAGPSPCKPGLPAEAVALAGRAARTTPHAAILAAAIRADFDKLVATAAAEKWDDTTPVPAEVFGPLWPGGPRPEWPSDNVADQVDPASRPSVATPTIPTQEELAKLPRWAQVFFAARCARRVLPLFGNAWPDAPSTHLGTLTHAVEIAELSATTAAPDGDATIASDAARAVARAAIEAYTAKRLTQANSEVARATADAARLAARSVVSSGAWHDAADAANASLAAASSFSQSAPYHVRAAIRGDFDNLARQSEYSGWDDTTPITSKVLFTGPIWPEGPPPGWPAEEPQSSPADTFDPVSPPAVVIAWDPTVVTPAQYARVVAALNALVRAHGGAGLKRLQSKPFAAPVPAEVPTP